MTPYHAGELAVQARAGGRALADRVGRIIAPEMSPALQVFVAAQSRLVVGALDGGGRPWASLLAGPPGFARAEGGRRLKVRAVFPEGDPLYGHLRVGASVGLLAIDLAARRRVRVNGRVEQSNEAGFALHVEQAFGNCPQYIVPRREAGRSSPEESEVRVGEALDQDGFALIAQADTLFVASAHPTGGADVSHRGGTKGFVRSVGSGRLELPDYAGNHMLGTLGNIEATGHAGLLFLDFVHDRVLHVTGQARIVWDEARLAGHPGALRVVELDVEQAVLRTGATGQTWA